MGMLFLFAEAGFRREGMRVGAGARATRYGTGELRGWWGGLHAGWCGAGEATRENLIGECGVRDALVQRAGQKVLMGYFGRLLLRCWRRVRML